MIVEVGGQEIEFPDSMSEAEVLSVVRKIAGEKYDPTEGMSGMDKFLAGAGKSFSETGAGIKQIGAGLGNLLGLVSDETVAGMKADEAERRKRDAPLMDTGTGFAGNLAGYVAQAAALPVGGAGALTARVGAPAAVTRVLANPVAESALYGLMQGAAAPVVEGESRGQNAALGGLLGGASTAALQGVGRALQAPGNMIDNAMQGRSTSEYARAVGLLDEAGIPLTTGQRTGTNWLKSAETTLAEIPFGGKPLQVVQESQKRAYQKQLLRLAGLDDGSDMITESALKRADEALGRKYADAFKGVEVDITTPEFLDGLAKIEAKHSQFLPFEQKSKVKQIIEDFLDRSAKQESGKVMSGDEYQRIRSHLGKLSKNTANSDGYVSGLYGDLKRLMDEAFEAAAGPEKFATDKQYAALKQLKEVYESSGGPAMSEGFISPAAVSRKAAKNGGSQEWRDFTRSAGAVLPDRLGNSGTAQRNMLIGLLTGGTLGAIDPTSLIYAPAATRAFSEATARGVTPNVGLLVPRFRNPVVERQVLAGGRGLPLGLLAAERNQ